MTADYVADCLFDLINESDLLDVKGVSAHKGSLRLTLFDDSRFRVEVKALAEESSESKNNC